MSNNPITLNGFLEKYKDTDGKEITHTKIGSAKMAIYGGKYSIPDDALSDFWKVYNKEVFVDKKDCYLTEAQRKDGGPILIDVDERYDSSINTRQHTDDHIFDLMELYIEKIRTIVEWDSKTFEIHPEIFILEKDSLNTTSDEYTKDGIHIIINIKLPYAAQMLVRDKVIKEVNNIFEDIPLINDYESLIDSCITTGKTNWQVFGSKKPAHDAYKLKRIYTAVVDDTGVVEFEETSVNKNTSFHNILPRISARSLDLHEVKLTEEALEAVKRRIIIINGKRKARIKSSSNVSNVAMSMTAFEEIVSPEKCDMIIDQILKMSTTNDNYDIIMADDMLQMLDSSYYDEYEKWMEVGWALKTVSPMLFPSWLKFSAKSEKFDWNQNDCYALWCEAYQGALTLGSLRYWARQCDPFKYDMIKKNSIDHYLNKTLEGETEYDVARLVFAIYEGQFKCTNIRNKIWYEFTKGRWAEIDSGTTLRQALSKRIHQIYAEKIHSLLTRVDACEAGSDEGKSLRANIEALSKMALKLKKTAWKQNIMRECCECFFDGDFMNLLDKNTELLCFKNGVLDIAQKVFRESKADDYLSLCTNTDYVEYDPHDTDHIIIRGEIEDFMKQLFPDPGLNRYMWEHLASVLQGDNRNQTFNIYTGCGRNGKSKMVEMMDLVLGDYKGSVPLALITQKRGSIGGVSPEVAQLKGLRYAVMQEPSKAQKMNEGIMKELTGGDPIQGRALFKDTVTFVPQFSLAVCTNHLFDIQSADDGTWRRIRVCDFKSKFVDEPSVDPKAFEFKVDRNIDKKFKRWGHVFTSMLIEKLFETDGMVKDCAAVLAPTQNYKAQQDYFTGFMKERIVKMDGAKIKKRDALNEFQEWYSELYGGKTPSGKELYEFLEKSLGKPTRLGWKGYKLYHAHDLVDDADIQPNGL